MKYFSIVMKVTGLIWAFGLFLAGASYTCFAQYPLSDINHIVHMGQSLGAGDQSLPVVTTSDPGHGNLMFLIGTHTWSPSFAAKPEDRDAKQFSLVPLHAQQRGGEGETIGNGLCDHLRVAIHNIKSNDKIPKFLFSFAGQGGRYLRELNKRHDDAKDPRAGTRQSGGGYYRTSIDDVRRAKSEARLSGQSYSVLAVTWMQGEANANSRLNRWDLPLERAAFLDAYQQDLIDLKNDYQQDIVEITGQSFKPLFLTYQTAGNMSGIAQLRASNEEKDIFMVGPTYMLPNAENSYYAVGGHWRSGDGIHLTADGERWLGEQFGKVIARIITTGEDWKPLQPLRATYLPDEYSFIVDFHVPMGSIVIDTAFLPPQGKGLGFEVYDASGEAYGIAEVTAVNKTALRFVLDKVPARGTKLFLQYGQQSEVFDVPAPISNIKLRDDGDSRGTLLELTFNGDLSKTFMPLMQEGVFYLSNRVSQDSLFTNIIVRDVKINSKGNTVLSGFAKDLKNGILFSVGQTCYVSRRYAYGNIRDEDEAQAIYKFADPSYGLRHGQPYPLWNWCIAFTDLPITQNNKP